MATITAKFAGQCKACGGAIRVGETIEWSKGAGSRHAVCPAKGAAGSSAKPWVEPTRETAPIRISRDCGSVRPGLDSEVGTTIRLGPRSGEHAGKVVVVVAQRRTWIAEDGLSFGLGDDQGWSLTLYCRLASDEETAKHGAEEQAAADAERARREAIAAAAAAKEAEVAAEKAGLADLTAGMLETETFSWEVFAKLPAGEQPVTVASWSTGPRHDAFAQRHTATTGETVYLLSSHDYDDDRAKLYAPEPVIHAAWRAWAQKHEITVASAMDFLSKYGERVVGADARRWIVEQAWRAAA